MRKKISRFGGLDHPGKWVGNQRRFSSIEKRQKRKGKEKSEENTNDKKWKNLMSKQTSFFFLNLTIWKPTVTYTVKFYANKSQTVMSYQGNGRELRQ